MFRRSLQLLVAVIAVVGAAVGLSAHAATASATTTLSPGSMIRGAFVEWGCTISAVGTLPDGSKAAMTAGHCFGDTDTKQGYWNATAYGNYLNTAKLGTVQYTSWTGIDTGKADYAIIKLFPGVHINGLGHTEGSAKLGDSVCKQGRVTGRTCGKVTSVNAQSVEATPYVIVGDSGSPLYGSDGKLIGQLSRMRPDGVWKPFGIPLPIQQPGKPVVYENTTRLLAEAKATTGFVMQP